MKRKIEIAAADILFIAHILLGIIILFGWLFPMFKFWYLCLLIGWLASWVLLGYCPFSKLEFYIRGKYEKKLDSNTEFIQHYVKKFFNQNISSKNIFVGGLCCFALLLFLSIITN